MKDVQISTEDTKKMQNVLNRIKPEAPDDFTSEAILTIGEEKMERFLNFSLGSKICYENLMVKAPSF